MPPIECLVLCSGTFIWTWGLGFASMSWAEGSRAVCELGLDPGGAVSFMFAVILEA